MLLTFLDKISGFFDRRFMVAYWSPVSIFVGLALLEAAVIYNMEEALGWWQRRSVLATTVMGFATLLLITILAYFLQSLTYPVVRLYAGYWPRLASFFERWGEQRQRQAFERVKDIIERRYQSYPKDPARLQPTRLGNVLVAAYDYAYQVYRINTPIWWPRLSPLLPETFRSQVDAALTPLLALLNLCTLLILFAFGGGLAAVLADYRWWLFALVLLGGLLAAHLCYRAAISQAANYGEHIRVAFDLYRHDLLKQLHVAVPEKPRDEWPLWDALGRWVYEYVPIWNSDDDPDPAKELYYDYPRAKPRPGAEQFVIAMNGKPVMTITRQEVEPEKP